jgi:hypothetical protein
MLSVATPSTTEKDNEFMCTLSCASAPASATDLYCQLAYQIPLRDHARWEVLPQGGYPAFQQTRSPAH